MVIPERIHHRGLFHFMTTKKSTKKAEPKSSKKAVTKAVVKVAKKPSKALKTAKKLAESKPVKKSVRRPAKPAEPETTKVLAVKNGESNVTVSTTKPDTELDKAKAAGLVVEAPNSISPEQAEKIAESRRTHEDERPPNSNLTIPELVARAWDEVRDTDPPLSDCVQSHVEKYLSHAQVILKGSSPLGGSTRLALFEQAVNRLMKEK
jgi:hypothetical protein